MKVEILLSALNYDFSNLENICLESDMLIINQCDREEKFIMSKDGYTIRVISTTERGIGLSRKKAVKNSRGDVLVFMDDDEVLKKGYSDIIVHSYENYPESDLLLFNISRLGSSERNKNYPNSDTKINYFNSLKYGAVNITVKRESLLKYDHNFDERFGNREIRHGEDTVFIFNALKKGFDIKYINKVIGFVDMKSSTWYTGVNEQYLFEKGFIFYELSPKFSLALILQYLLRKSEYKKASFSFFKAFQIMNLGRRKNKYDK